MPLMARRLQPWMRACKTLCRHIAETYWPHMTAEQVQEMAESFVEEGV